MSTYLGQNFLKDSGVRSYIANAIAKYYKALGAECLIEIGPWKWAITKKIYTLSPHFFVVEKDTLMLPYLTELGLEENQIVLSDILEADLSQKIASFWTRADCSFVVGNLPYYITSPIFRKLFVKGEPDFLGGIFMIQEEVGLKIMSSAEKKSYLWWLVNWGYEVRYLKMVPPKAFSPAPKVKSCLVLFLKKDCPEAVDLEDLISFLELFAPYSRKTLGRIAKLQQKHCWNQLFILPEHLQSKRLEELEWTDIAMILQK